ncbi:MAG TPA: hypothetical protein VJ810_14935 [Blastocatellia bacterium]|nr:hypothetical protein [Blastocatellia bacterium]
MDGFFTKYFGSTNAAEIPFSVPASLTSLLEILSGAFSDVLSETNANWLLNRSLSVTDDVEGLLLEDVDDFGD